MSSIPVNYGVPVLMPLNIQVAWLSNEDIGLTAAIAAADNVHKFEFPRFGSIDHFSQAITLHKWEWHLLANENGGDLTQERLESWGGYLGRDFPLTFAGLASDQSDESVKSKITGPASFGQYSTVTTAGAAEGIQRQPDSIHAVEYPLVPLDLARPYEFHLVNRSVTITAGTNAVAAKDFNGFEAVMMKVYFTVRNLSAAEMAFQRTAFRFTRPHT